MIFLSLHRIAILLRVHWRLMLACACASSLVSFLIGAFTPYLFRSESMLMIPPPKIMDPTTALDNTDVLRLTNLFRSPKVIVPVVEAQFKKYGKKANLLIPASWSWLDFRQRFNIFKTKLMDVSAVTNEAPTLDETLSTAEIFAGLVGRQIITEPDQGMRTIRVIYEAGSPDYAQATNELLLNEFIKAMSQMEQQELKQQEKYLLGAVDQQLETIRDIENKMRSIVERYPELSAGGGGEARSGAGALASKYLEKQEVLKKLEGEFDANRKFLESIQGDINVMSANRQFAAKMNSELSTKVAEEIGDLEFKKMQYIQVSGYEETHPEIVKITTRIDLLKNVLANPGASKLNSSNYKSLYQKKSQLSERNKSLVLERETVNLEMDREQIKFRELVRKNFDLDSLMRNLNVNVSIAGELYRELQKARLNMAGSQGKATVLMAPTLSVHASNVSVRKRAVFGFALGIALAISLLILFDLFSPILLHEEDLVPFKDKVYGPFRATERGKHQLFSWFAALRLEKAKRLGMAPVRLKVGLVGSTDKRNPWEPFVNKALSEMRAKNESVGLVVIRDPESWEQRYDWGFPPEAVEELIIDDVPNTLGLKMAEIESRYDYTFVVLAENRSGIPIESYLEEYTDHVLIVSQLGLSPLKKLRTLGNMFTRSATKGHLVLAPYHLDKHNPLSIIGSKGSWFKKAA